MEPVLRFLRDGLSPTSLSRGVFTLWSGLALGALAGCAGAPQPRHARPVEAGGPSSRIEERALSDRPPLAIIERQGDPEVALAFASLAAASPELHAALGEVLAERLSQAGFPTQLVAHGLGFELILLAENSERAGAALTTLLQALSRPVSSAELAATTSSPPDRAAPSAMARCSAELPNRRRISDPAELERERMATFARDRAALSVVGDATAAAAVGRALSAGPDWPELGRVRTLLASANTTEILRGERATLSVALTVGDGDRALGAAELLGDAKSALNVRLAALGAGLRLRRVLATAHPEGACLRIDSDVDASPVPDARRLGFAVELIETEATQALASVADENRLDATALSATDPRLAARAAAYHALTQTVPDMRPARLVALTTPDEGPLAPSIDAAVQQARAEAPALDVRVKVEAGQPGFWALLSAPCGAVSERAETAGHGAVAMSAAAMTPIRGVRLEPWVGADGLGLLGFTERLPGESDADAAARLGDALGQALLTPPSAIDVASARASLVKAAGSDAHPLLDGLLEVLAPGHVGALTPRGTATSLQAASREAVLARQRDLLRLPHRLAVLSPSNSGDAALVTRALSRWLKSPDPSRSSACESEVSTPARSELALAPSGPPEGNYLAFRVPARAQSEVTLLAELLNAPGGPLARSLAEPDLAGAARALVLGTSSARALVIQISAFDGREGEALTRVQRLFERLASGGVLGASEVDAALTRQKNARRLAALDPRYRLVQLIEGTPSTPPDAASVRRLVATLRPEAAVIGRTLTSPAPSAGKSPGSR